MKRKIVINLISIFLISFPFIALAKGLVPDCGVFNGDSIEKCDFDDLMTLFNTLINYLLFVIATPLAALIIVYAGVLYLFDGGNSSQVKKAKQILINVVFGYVIALSAWLIVKMILKSLGFEGGEEFINY